MGRMLDLLAEVAQAIEEGAEGLNLPVADRERLSSGWTDEDVEDAVALVRDNLLQGELVDCADSLSGRLVELLGSFGEKTAFEAAAAGQASLSLEAIGQLARRVARLEEVLHVFREGAPPDRRGFDALTQRLADAGIEAEMRDQWPDLGDQDEEEDT